MSKRFRGEGHDRGHRTYKSFKSLKDASVVAEPTTIPLSGYQPRSRFAGNGTLRLGKMQREVIFAAAIAAEEQKMYDDDEVVEGVSDLLAVATPQNGSTHRRPTATKKSLLALLGFLYAGDETITEDFVRDFFDPKTVSPDELVEWSEEGVGLLNKCGVDIG